MAADWLQPIYDQIRTGVTAGGYVQVDETPIDYLEPGNGKTKQGYLWTGSRPEGEVFFHWETSRATACLDNLIPATFTGTIRSDRYVAYRAVANRRGPTIEVAGCWAHVRRKFHEAAESVPRLAGWLLKQIQQLYRIEANLRAHHASPRLRAAVRISESRPVVQSLGVPCSNSKSANASCPKTSWESRLIMPWASGARWKFI